MYKSSVKHAHVVLYNRKEISEIPARQMSNCLFLLRYAKGGESQLPLVSGFKNTDFRFDIEYNELRADAFRNAKTHQRRF